MKTLASFAYSLDTSLDLRTTYSSHEEEWRVLPESYVIRQRHTVGGSKGSS